MRNRFVLGAVATAMTLGILPAGAALAQPQATTPSAPAPHQVSVSTLHLVTGTVRDAAGQAVSGACVLAVGGTGQVRIARTGVNGSYVLALPATGDYSLRYRDCKPGQAATEAAPDRQVVIGTSPITSLPATVLARAATASPQSALAAAGLVAPQHRRIIVAQPGEAIENGQARRLTAGSTPWAVVTGKVTSPSGRPLAGICMWIVGKNTAEGTETGKHGTYRMEVGGGGFTSGRFPVEFDSSCDDADPFVPIAPGRWAPEWYKGRFSAFKANKVLVKVGKTTRGVNAVMRAAGEVSGTISGSDHRRLKNACAVLTDSTGKEEFGQAITNARGAYTITGLDAGSYRLVGVAGCTGGASDYGQAFYPRASSIRNARPVQVRLGRRTSSIDVVVPKLGTITGQVRLGGKAGRPLAGICVDAFSPANPALNGGYAVTSHDGKYRMEGLAPGRYQVDASAGGCGNKGDFAPSQYPRLVRVSDATTIAGVNVYLQPGGILSGTVTAAATGKPLAGICVGDDNGDFAITASNGTYTIDQLPAERIAFEFAGCSNTGSYAPQYYDGQAVPEAARDVVITAGRTTGGISAAMLPGATISGTVTNASGHPGRAVCVFAEAGAPGAGFTPFGGNIVKADGTYSVANLAPGQYSVAFFAGCEGPSNAAALQWFKGQPDSGTAGLVSAQAGQPVAGVDAVVSPGGTIKGTVTESGSPVDFDCAYAIRQSTGAEAGFQANRGSGQFAISGLAAGRYRVFAYDCLEGSTSTRVITAHPVSVRAGHTTGGVHLALRRGGDITGKVTVAGSHAAARDVCVEAYPARASAADWGYGGFARTSATGTYRLTGLNTARYAVSILTTDGCHAGSQNLAGTTLRRTVRVTQGNVTSNVSASLHPGGSIAGRVTGPGGKDVAGACVELLQLPGGLMDETETGAYGAYTLPGLAAGRYKVELGDPNCSDGGAGLAGQWYDGAAGSGPATVVTVRAGRTTGSIDASLPADGGISGSVTGPGDAALTGICVSAVPAAAGQSPVYTVSADGSYQLPDLLPGRYRVEFQSGCGQAGLATQWWDDAASSQAARVKVIDVGSGHTVTGVSALMASG